METKAWVVIMLFISLITIVSIITIGFYFIFLSLQEQTMNFIESIIEELKRIIGK